MKILYIVNGLRYGGLERQLTIIIKEMALRNNKIYLIDLHKPYPLTSLAKPYLSEDIFYVDRRKSRIPFSLYKIYQICKKINQDIIHVMDSFSAFYAMPITKLLKIKFINGAIRHAGVSSGFEYKWERFLLKSADMIISNSKAGLKFYGLEGKVLYNFIDRNRFQQTNASLKRIVMNANFSEYKDHLTLLKAAQLLFEENKIELISLIGDGKNRAFYESVAKTMGLEKKIKFLGYVDAVENELLNYGIGILCSTKKYKEGISNSILEYMGSGLIAIGPNIGGIPEIIEDGYNGFLYEPENHISLYNKIKYVLDHQNKMDEIINNAYKTLENQFNPNINCDLLYNWYETLAIRNK